MSPVQADQNPPLTHSHRSLPLQFFGFFAFAFSLLAVYFAPPAFFRGASGSVAETEAYAHELTRRVAVLRSSSFCARVQYERRGEETRGRGFGGGGGAGGFGGEEKRRQEEGKTAN